jgi:hypothetical protein
LSMEDGISGRKPRKSRGLLLELQGRAGRRAVR